MRLPERVWNFCLDHDLLPPGTRVVLGVSGGPDSLCLLDVLHHLARDQQLDLIVAHLDHGLRPAAADDAEFVRSQAALRGLPCRVDRADTAAFASEQGLSLEAAGRRLRYRFLAQVAREAGAVRVAVAHTADDQAETVLMHFLRGSGLAGLRGMAPRTEIGDMGIEQGEPAAHDHLPTSQCPISLVRPLLGEPRSAILAYCHKHNLQPRHDETNEQTRYWRNRVRHEVLPFLEQENLNLRATLARTAEVLAGEYALARAAAAGLMARTAPAGWQAPGCVAWDRGAWQALSLPEQRALLRLGIEQLRGVVRDVDFAPLDAAARFGRTAAAGQSCDIAAGLRLVAGYRRLVLVEGPAAPPDLDVPLLDARGELPDEWRLDQESLSKDAWDWNRVTGSGPWVAYVDAARVTAPLAVRARRPGERFQPLGLAGHSDKVADYMINARVDAALRRRWPLVTCGPRVVWLAGLRLDERFKVTEDTQTVLRLSFAPTATA
jgi:tRNA(Ile)-lysidine synthase